LVNAKVTLLWISTGILEIRRHLESDKKLFFREICPTKIQAQIKKQRKNVPNSLSYGRKTKFSVILKITAILKTCGKNFPIFSILKLSYLYILRLKKILKNTLFEIMSFLWFHQESPKILSWIRRTHGSDLWRVGKSLMFQSFQKFWNKKCPYKAILLYCVSLMAGNGRDQTIV
jgi:hypothetical protein